MKVNLEFIPHREKTNIGIITFNSTVQLYTHTMGDVSMIHMTDIFAPFCPIPKSLFLFNLDTEKNKIEIVLNRIASLYVSADKSTVSFGSSGSSAGSAIKIAADSLKGSYGKILLFCSSMPSLGYGKLTNKNNPQLYNSDNERSLYCRSDAYKELLKVCKVGYIGIDVFACTNEEIDLSSIAALSVDTGGELYYYPKFDYTLYTFLIRIEWERNYIMIFSEI